MRKRVEIAKMALAIFAIGCSCSLPIAASAAPISYSYLFTKNLSVGARGPEVKELQKFLNKLGFTIAKAGPGSPGKEALYFGTSTQVSLKEFQKKYMLSQTGKVDAALRAAINPHQVNVSIIASSSAAHLSWPHGTVQVGKAIVLGTVSEIPGRLFIFPNPSDPSHFISTTTTGYADLASIDYDASHNRVYVAASRPDNRHLVILSVDPKTLEWSQVFEYTGVSFTGFSTLKTDGNYVYVATQSYPAHLLKIHIVDWSLSVDRPVANVLGGFHSSALYMYPDREEWYVINFAALTRFYKVNTEDLSETSIVLPRAPHITNDVYFRPINENGGIVYLASEVEGGIEAVNTANMTARHYATPPTYGVFSDGKDLYSVKPFDNEIVEYPDFVLTQPIIMKLPGEHVPNEWFPSSTINTGYFTDFTSDSALYQYSKK